MSLYFMAVGALLVLAVLAAIWLIGVYNGLVRQRNLKDEAWSGIRVQLKKRHDLVGNLINTVKGYLAHERGLLEQITRTRASAINASGVSATGASEDALSRSLGRLFATAENYPELRSSDNVLQMQESLKEVEEALSLARRYYNGTVRDLNTKIESFPVNIVAGMFGFVKAEFFELNSISDAEAPVVNL